MTEHSAAATPTTTPPLVYTDPSGRAWTAAELDAALGDPTAAPPTAAEPAEPWVNLDRVAELLRSAGLEGGVGHSGGGTYTLEMFDKTLDGSDQESGQPVLTVGPAHVVQGGGVTVNRGYLDEISASVWIEEDGGWSPYAMSVTFENLPTAAAVRADQHGRVRVEREIAARLLAGIHWATGDEYELPE